MHLVIQPCASSAAREHFINTVQRPVPIARILPYLSAKDRALVTATFSSPVAVWGVTAAANGTNATAWESRATNPELTPSRLPHRD